MARLTVARNSGVNNLSMFATLKGGIEDVGGMETWGALCKPLVRRNLGTVLGVELEPRPGIEGSSGFSYIGFIRSTSVDN